MVQKKSVEEIWKELNAKPAARSASSNPAKAQNVIIPGLGSFTAPLPRPPASHQEAATPTPAYPSVRLATAIPASGLSPPPHALSTSAATREPGGGGYDPTQVGLSHEAVATYIASMQRLINCLTDPDRGTRRQAALSLQTKLLEGDATTPAASPAMLQAVACGPLRVPLITMMHDVVEKCRAVAVELLEHCVKQVPDPCPLLPGLVPALLQRMGQLPVQEPAEEVRLSLVRLLAACVDRAPGKELGGHAADFTTVLCRALEDGFPDIKRLACSTCACLAARAPPGSLSPHSGKLVATLVVNLGHQHAKVRCAVLEALDLLLAYDAVPGGSVTDVVAPGLKPLAHDRAPAVREALFRTLAGWLGAGRGQGQPVPPPDGQLGGAASGKEAGQQGEGTPAGCGGETAGGPGEGGSWGGPGGGAAGGDAGGDSGCRGSWVGGSSGSSRQQALSQQGAQGPALSPDTHLVDLLPILLVGVTDPQASIASLTLQLLEQCGHTWLANHPDPALDRHGVQASSAAAGPEGRAVELSAAPGSVALHTMDISDASDDSSADTAAVAASQLGPPYNGRPPSGLRAMARSVLDSLLPPVARELGAWTVPQRAAAARSLHTLLVLAEAGVTPHLLSLLPALCNAIGDDDAEVAGWVVKVVHVIGAHVAAARWLPLMLDHLGQSRLSLTQRANGLVVLSGLMHAAARAGQPPRPGLLVSLADCLVGPELRSCLEQPAARLQLLAVATNTLKWAGPCSQQVAPQLYCLLLGLWGCDPNPAWRAPTTLLAQAMAALASACQAAAEPLGADQDTATAAGGTAVPDSTMEGAAEGQAAAGGQGGDGSCGKGPQAGVGAGVGAAAAAAAAQRTVGGTGGRGGDGQPSPGRGEGQPAQGSRQAGGGGSTWVPAGWQAVAAEHAPALMDRLCKEAARWSVDSPDWLTLRAMLLTSGPHTLAALALHFIRAAAPLMVDQEGEAGLRLALLQLVDAVMEDEARGAALAGEQVAAALLDKVLLPPLIWRAGKTAAAVRFAAVTALATQLRRRLVPGRVVLRLVSDGSLLPLLLQELEEDWYVDVRLAACWVAECLLRLVGHRLSHEPRRQLYPALTKRLDDSSNAVRLAACRALVAFCCTLDPGYCETNAGYLAQAVIIHMDDSEPAIQEAAAEVLETLAAKKPVAVRDEVLKVRDRFRARHFCDRVLAACLAARPAPATGSAVENGQNIDGLSSTSGLPSLPASTADMELS